MRIKEEYDMKKRNIIIIIIIVVLIILLLIIKYKNNYIPKDDEIFLEGSGHLSSDNQYIDNQVMVYFYEDIEFDEVKKIVWKLNGKIDGVGKNSMNLYAITLKNKNFKNVEEIDKYCNKIKQKYNQIESCSVNSFEPIDDCTKGPC